MTDQLLKTQEKIMADTTKADLAAANREVKSVMDQNAVLKKEAEEAYQQGYRDALQATDNLARINQTQAGMITYFMGIISGGLKHR
jgi:flagellar biosynthesis/type III secretory pathway protein FliH